MTDHRVSAVWAGAVLAVLVAGGCTGQTTPPDAAASSGITMGAGKVRGGEATLAQPLTTTAGVAGDLRAHRSEVFAHSIPDRGARTAQPIARLARLLG